MLDLHFVAPGLAVGARFPAAAAPLLARMHGISRVVDVRVEERDDERVLLACGIRLLHLPTEDTRAISQEKLRHGVRFVSEGLDRGEGVLVHCQHGIGRSALLALCVLVDRGAAPLEAMERAKAARRVVSPSPDQIRAFLAFAAEVKAERGAPWAVPSLKDVGQIAWRHLLGGADAAAASTRGR
ncbi:MAG TPA: dual specificity protein phosphatase [Anaeromyxobacter sp.]|nr:dual specificity protein phosphatase [Anaeromyxobacter sp.]